jgi:hypothetical protein
VEGVGFITRSPILGAAGSRSHSAAVHFAQKTPPRRLPNVAMAPIDSESLPPQSRASSESAPLDQDEANAPRRPSTPAPKIKRSRSAAFNESNVLEWTEVMVETPMILRYDTFVARFGNAKNNAAIEAAWLLLASEMSHLHQKPISTEQCKNKVVIALFLDDLLALCN